jgi:hypothetical protein
MKLDKVTKTIKGSNYEIGYLPAMYNTNLFIKFSSIIGGSLPKFFGSLNSNDFSLIGEGISKIMTSVYVNDPQGAIILDILSQTTRNGVAINKTTFDEFYTGNIEEMIEALIESMVVHFKPFLPIDKLSGFLEKGEKIQKKIMETSIKN